MGHERLRCNWVLMETAKRVPAIVRRAGRGNSNLVDQFKRALSSGILNLVEGNSRTSARERARFFDIAIASIAEAATAIEVLAAYGAISESEARGVSEGMRIGYAMIINLKHATASGI